jgi:hypothetical protein
VAEFNEDVTINGKLVVNGPAEFYIGGEKFIVQSTGAQNAGALRFGGNELSIESHVEDPPKLRLASLGSVGGGISWGVLRDLINFVQDEFLLWLGQPAEDAPSSLGGQIKTFCRKKNSEGDGAMVLTDVLSTAYGQGNTPKRYFDGAPQHDLGPFASSVPGPVIVSKTNLTGDAPALTLGDSSWLTAVSPSLDTMVEADIPADGTTLEVQLRRTQASGTQPYVYVDVDGVTVISAYRPPASTSPQIISVAVADGGTRRVKVRTAAQGGTCEIGGIRIV